MCPVSGGSLCCGGWCGCGGAENRCVRRRRSAEAPRCGAASDGVDDAGGGWATSALSYDDTTVSALARHGCGLAHGWDAIEVEAKARTSDPDRLAG